MTRSDLITSLEQLAEEALAANEREAASVLYALAGALASNNEWGLMEVCAQETKNNVQALTAHLN